MCPELSYNYQKSTENVAEKFVITVESSDEGRRWNCYLCEVIDEGSAVTEWGQDTGMGEREEGEGKTREDSYSSERIWLRSCVTWIT